ncbi:MAG: nucleoside hydrolase [Pirellulales bacterium]|jgi:inosine-uridine nucleoside N-ribohydrolase
MVKKVILDVDPGISDAVAVCLALFDPTVEVVAVTAVAGNVEPDQATRNVQAIIEQVDPPRWPRIGAASLPDQGLPVDRRHIFGADGLGNTDFHVAELHNRHLSEKVIADQLRAAPEEITLVALGPLTNIARVFQRDPALCSLVGDLVIQGGTIAGPGNVTPAAEFNVFCDPMAAQEVFRSPSTKTLIPLDVTSQVVMTFDCFDRLPAETTKVGRFLRRILPFAFRSHRQELGVEAIYLDEVVALLAATHRELFTMEDMAGDVETMGELTTGATVFDRRRVPVWRRNIEVATKLDTRAAMEAVMQGLARAGAAG